MTLKLGTQHRVHEHYLFFSNDDLGLIMTIFMTGSVLFPNASAWLKAKFVLIQHILSTQVS